MFKPRIVAAALLAATIAGCEEPAPPAPPIRPVRTFTVDGGATAEIVSLTGHIRARDEASLAFRLDGRVIERPVDVGDVVQSGQVVARLEAQDQDNAVRNAQANLSAAEAVLTEARLTFQRQQGLVESGWTPRARFDEARQVLESAQARVEAARAQLALAEDQLGYTTLYADVPGAVTAVGAEPGEVVHAGQMIVQLAHEGGRDAVFDVPEELIRTAPHDVVVEIALTDDLNIKATGRVREVAPQADATTRTFQVKVGIIDAPADMRLGSTVTGRIRLVAPSGVEIPAGALTEANGSAAVWLVDPKSWTVSLRNVEIARFDPNNVVVSSGLKTGDVVVIAGVQVLRPGQQVRQLGAD
jgi:RND family efflux transporter MFP subunit